MSDMFLTFLRVPAYFSCPGLPTGVFLALSGQASESLFNDITRC